MTRRTPIIVVAVLIAGLCLAQTATVLRNVNLRPTPSTAQPAIRLLTPPEELRLLSPTRTNGYYNVATDDEIQGWVYGNFVRVDDSVVIAVVERNTNLRAGPSSSQPVIRLLTPPEELVVLDPTPTGRYYHLRSQAGQEGWAYGPNLEITEGEPGTPPPPTPVSVFPDAHDPPPAGWTGPVFRLSQSYPTSPPAPGPMPWKQFDFRTQAEQYLRAVLAYAMEGNREVEWVGQNNATRKWYHTPWLHTTVNGREFLHGLTRERSSRPRELHPSQATTFPNYAVGMYNPAGGHIVGQVWRDPENPDPSAAQFPDGTVAVKLLFTTATVAEVPYLQNAFNWDAHVAAPGASARTVQSVRLLQIDVAVRDSRADSTTGWVFGTFSYDGGAPGTTPWERMVPIGLMWGNDPTLTPAAHQGGQRTQESMIVNSTVGVAQHLGWLGRLNGPVDNPRSACLSCHGTAQDIAMSASLPGSTIPDSEKMRWFRNILAGQPFDAGQVSLDYSLQLSAGIERFRESRQAPER